MNPTIVGTFDDEGTAIDFAVFSRSGSCARALLAALLALGSVGSAAAGERVVLERLSRYNHIQVVEDDSGLRTLRFAPSGARQSVARPGDPGHLELAYARVVVAALGAAPAVRRVLVIGLGGGSLPMYLRDRRSDLWIDVVEIDPAVADVARSHFGFAEDARLRLHLADGRAFVERAEPVYDAIVMDAYGADSIVRSLATRECLRAMRRALTPAGVVIADVWGRAHNPLYDSMVRTYADAFRGLAILTVDGADNQVFIAWRDREPMTRDELGRHAAALGRALSTRFDLPSLVSRGYRRPAEVAIGGTVLRDDDGADSAAADPRAGAPSPE